MIFLLVGSARAQMTEAVFYKHELRLLMANDNFSPPFHDRYFTNGLGLSFSRVLNGGIAGRNDLKGRKTILQLELGQNIYTPHTITSTRIEEFDRPYAGYLFLKSSMRSFLNRHNNLQLGLNVGVIGPGAGGKQLQSWWHRLIAIEKPMGWDSQINGELALTFEAGYMRSWIHSPGFDLITSANMQAGTAFDNVSAGIAARIGDLNSIDRSAYTQSLAGSYFSETDSEWFLFLEVRNRFVFHNTLIQGSLFRPSRSVHTTEANPSYISTIMGFAYSKGFISWMLSFHRLTPEVVEGKSHTFGKIELGVRL